MKYKAIPIKLHDFDELFIEHDLIRDVQNALFDEIHNKREKLIIQALEKRGHVFQTKQQLYEFAKQCTVVTYEDKPDYKELHYEDELICSWSEKITFEFNNNNYKSSININIG